MLLNDLSDSCFVAAHEALRAVSDVFKEEYDRLPRSKELAELFSSTLSAAGGDLVLEGFGEFAVRISVKHRVAARALKSSHCVVVPLGQRKYSLLAYLEQPVSAPNGPRFELVFGVVTSVETKSNRTSFVGPRKPVQIFGRLLHEQLKSRRWWLIEVNADRRAFDEPEALAAPFPAGFEPYGAIPRGKFGDAYNAAGHRRELGEEESKLLFDGPLAPLYKEETSLSASAIEGVLRSVAPLKGVPPRRWPPSVSRRTSGRRARVVATRK